MPSGIKPLFALLVGLALPAQALDLDLGYDLVELTQDSQTRQGLTQLFEVVNAELGSNVVVSVRGIPASAFPGQAPEPITLRIRDAADRPLLTAPLLAQNGNVSFSLRKDLWRRSSLQFYVEGTYLPAAGARDQLLTVHLPTYPMRSFDEALALCTSRDIPSAPPSFRTRLDNLNPYSIPQFLLSALLALAASFQPRRSWKWLLLFSAVLTFWAFLQPAVHWAYSHPFNPSDGAAKASALLFGWAVGLIGVVLPVYWISRGAQALAQKRKRNKGTP